MIQTHCRIGKITLKKSPHLTEIRPAPRGSELFAKMRGNLEKMIPHFEETGIAGYVIVTWDFHGFFSRASGTHKDSFIGTTLIPPVVSEILRRDIAQAVAEDVFTGQL